MANDPYTIKTEPESFVGTDRWYHQSGCLNPDPNDFAEARRLDQIFFAKKGEHNKVAEARAICAACPVRVDCLISALAEEENHRSARHGVRGGLDAQERTRLGRGHVTIYDRPRVRAAARDVGIPVIAPPRLAVRAA